MGFLETPYRKVEGGKIDMKREAEYLSAEGEDYRRIAQANSQIDDKGSFLSDRIK